MGALCQRVFSFWAWHFGSLLFKLTWLCSLDQGLPIVARHHQPVLLLLLGLGFGGRDIIPDCGQYLLELDIRSLWDRETFKYSLENSCMEVHFLHFDMLRYVLIERFGEPTPRISFTVTD